MANKRSQFDEDRLAGLLDAVGSAEPSDDAVRRAVAQAQKKVRAEQEYGAARATARGGHRRRMRIMYTGIAAAFFATIGLQFLLLTPAQTSAAETIRNAVNAYDAFDGWVRIEQWTGDEFGWQEHMRVQPKQHKTLMVLGTPPACYLQYIDAEARITSRYDSDLGALYIGETSGGARDEIVPVGEHDLLRLITETINDEACDVSREERGDTTRILVTSKGDAGTPNNGGIFWKQLAVDIDRRTGHIIEALVRDTADDVELRPQMRWTYGVEGVEGPTQLPGAPADAPIIDNRPDEQTSRLLDQVDDVLRQGVGVDTAIVIHRTANSATGELSTGGRLTVIAQERDRWLKLSWQVSPGAQPNAEGTIAAPEGWPTPTLEAVVEAVSRTPPQQLRVFDGKTLWYRGGGPRYAERDRDEWDAWRLESSVAGLMWRGRSSLLCRSSDAVWTTITTRPDPHRGNSLILEATQRIKTKDGDRMTLKPFETRRVFYDPQFGPLPYAEEFEAHWRESGVQRTDYSFGYLIMAREPVRLPTRWRTLATCEASVSYTHLIPCFGQQAPDDWFADPNERWPIEDKTANATTD